MLTDRKTRLETTVDALEWEQAELAATLKAQTLTRDQIRTLMDFAAQIGGGMELADTDFQARRSVIEALKVHVTLIVEDGQKVARVWCVIGEEEFAYRLLAQVRGTRKLPVR